MVTTSRFYSDLSFRGRLAWLFVHYSIHPDMVRNPDKTPDTAAKLDIWPSLDDPLYYDGNSGFSGMGQQGKEKREADSACPFFNSAGAERSLVAVILYPPLASRGIPGDNSNVDIHIAHNETVQ